MKYKHKAWIFGKLCITTCLQGSNAPFIDKATTHDLQNRAYDGIAILLKPWVCNKWGESLPQTALVLTWRKGLKDLEGEK